MSIFNELLPKICDIHNVYTKNINDDLKEIFKCYDKFEEAFQNSLTKAREEGQKDKNLVTALQSIDEDDGEPSKPQDKPKRSSSGKSKATERLSSDKDEGAETCSSSESGSEPRRLSNKRGKNEVDGMSSPEQDKRQKRNASVKAQSIISKQVNVNLTQKLRREDTEKTRGRRRKDDDKENEQDLTNIQIKQEKISIPPEPMDTDSLPLNIDVKQEMNKDEIAMPPPAAPMPRPRRAAREKSDLAKEKLDSEEDTSMRRRNMRTRKQTESMPPPAAPVPAARATRASSRASRRASSRKQPEEDEQPAPPAEPRPKRTRNKKKASVTPAPDIEDTTQTEITATASPAEKPRPKRTRRGQKAAEKQEPPKPEEPKPEEKLEISPKKEPSPKEEPHSPIIPPKQLPKDKKKEIKSKIPVSDKKDATPEAKVPEPEVVQPTCLNETRVLHKLDTSLVMDTTVVLTNGVYNHAPDTPTPNNRNMNETVVIETCNRETIILDKPNAIMDATVVLDKGPKVINISEDNSIMTDDNSDAVEHTPPKPMPVAQPTSAVKEKVQQFEEMASRVTRTKTRAMAKKVDASENHTPPDKVSKVILSAETLTKMNNLIFNGKAPQISTSASKPRTNVPVPVPTKTVPSSASKISAINKAKEAEESLKREKEDARKKKEALLEAKREQQRRKREEKMAAAAAAREAAEKERLLQLQAAARERLEKQASADLGKLERIKEAERKKQENARKAAEIEERRRAEDLKQKQKLEEEQRREAARMKQIQEAEATKKEEALMAKEIEKRQKEYIEKHRIKQKMEDRIHNKFGTPVAHYPPIEPAYMLDGFQYLNSDEEGEEIPRPVPTWSTSKVRKAQLFIQSQLAPRHIDKLFSVRVHSPDLREIFPNIERSRLKRTSSAVWRTPPQRLPKVAE